MKQDFQLVLIGQNQAQSWDKIKDDVDLNPNKEMLRDRSEFIVNVDIDEYFSREELPRDKYIDVLKEITEGKFKDFHKYKVRKLDMVVGLNQLVDVGSK